MPGCKGIAFASQLRSTIRDIRVIRGCLSDFLRNGRRSFAQYTGERPKLTSPWHAGARECGTKAAW